MSVARITTVTKAAKDQGECSKCGKKLPAGSAYLWWKMGFRSRYRHKRCTDPKCYPRPSERESSQKASILAAIEDFEDQEYDSVEAINDGLESVAEAFREFADECEEALSQWENGNYQLEERRDMAESAADAIEGGWEAEEFELDDIREEYDGEWKLDEDGSQILDDDNNAIPADQEEFDAWAAQREAEHIQEQLDSAKEFIGDAEGELP